MADLIVRLQGGLGNQMFQYAFGYALAKRQQKKVYYDLSWFEKVKKNKGKNKGATFRELELQVFTLSLPTASASQLSAYYPGRLAALFGKKPQLIREKEINSYEPELLERDIGYFDGYFQTEKYFAPYRQEIIDSFSLSDDVGEENNFFIKRMCESESVALHVRRGDYTLAKNQAYHGLCSLEYYQQAIEYAVNHLRNPHFFLFSDDIPWVRENLRLDYPFDVVDINHGKNAYKDLWLMKNCRHNIVANSSFSWWGAWLGEYPDKIVIAPKKWQASNVSEKTDIVPEKWVRL